MNNDMRKNLRKIFTGLGSRKFSTSSALNISPATLAYIRYLKLQLENGFVTRECD